MDYFRAFSGIPTHCGPRCSRHRAGRRVHPVLVGWSHSQSAAILMAHWGSRSVTWSLLFDIFWCYLLLADTCATTTSTDDEESQAGGRGRDVSWITPVSRSWMPFLSPRLNPQKHSSDASSGLGYVSQSLRVTDIMWILEMAVCQNLVPLVNPKIAGKWMFIPLKMVLIDILIHSQMGINVPKLGHGKHLNPSTIAGGMGVGQRPYPQTLCFAQERYTHKWRCNNTHCMVWETVCPDPISLSSLKFSRCQISIAVSLVNASSYACWLDWVHNIGRTFWSWQGGNHGKPIAPTIEAWHIACTWAVLEGIAPRNSIKLNPRSLLSKTFSQVVYS